MSSLIDSFTGAGLADASRQSAELLQNNALENINMQNNQLAQIDSLTQPYRSASINQAIPQLSALAFGGDINYTPSKLYEQQLEAGRTGILRNQAGAGNLRSSNTFERLSDMQMGAADQDLKRFEARLKDLLNLGIMSTNQMGSAGQQISNNMSGIYNNLGQGLNTASQNEGNANNMGFQNLSNLLGGAGELVSGFFGG